MACLITFWQPDFLWNVNVQIAKLCANQSALKKSYYCSWLNLEQLCIKLGKWLDGLVSDIFCGLLPSSRKFLAFSTHEYCMLHSEARVFFKAELDSLFFTNFTRYFDIFLTFFISIRNSNILEMVLEIGKTGIRRKKKDYGLLQVYRIFVGIEPKKQATE